jgi:hypothetical protein
VQHEQDFFHSIPEGEPIGGRDRDDETFVGRVIIFVSADIAPPSSSRRTVWLAFVQWLEEYRQDANERTIVDKWMCKNPLYEPVPAWYDFVDVNRILGPEVLVPNFPWTTIPFSETQHKARKFQFGKADHKSVPGSGSQMYIRHTIIGRSARMHPNLPFDQR